MLDRNSVIIKHSLEETFLDGLEYYRIILFSAPCGFGKTTVARALLSKHNVFELNASNAEFISGDIPKDCNVVLVDDLQYMLEPERQKALCDIIRSRIDLQFVLLGRGRIPGWLMPFQFAGILLIIDSHELSFDRISTQRLLESRGIKVSHNEMNSIQRDLKGYPVGMDILFRKLKGGRAYSVDILNEARRDLFHYFEEAVFHRLEVSERMLLVSLAPFDGFNLELARLVSGDPHTGEVLGIVQRDTMMLRFDENDTYKFWPIFQQFLKWQLHQKLTDAEQCILFSRAALYYELEGELDKALQYYTLAGEQSKVYGLLVKNAEQNPSQGYYRELKNYYFALSQDEILKSVSLMSGMSMLYAMCLDYESSEYWYNELQNYATNLKKTDTEYKDVRAKLIYLDIALPQRTNKGLTEIIGRLFHLIKDKQFKMARFSITSTLPSLMNGGKDFCEWSKKDDFIYATMGKTLEVVLGQDGFGFADCAICESKFEKGEDVSRRLLTLMSRLGEIQVRGTPDIEFAVIGLLARVQVSHGKAEIALESLNSLRDKFLETGKIRFLANVDAMICRINLLLNKEEAAQIWYQDKAPKNDVQLWILWRYQYMTRAMVQIREEEYEEALLLLIRMLPYCEHCERVMDGIHIRLLMVLCHERLGNEIAEAEFGVVLDTCYEYKFVWPVAQYGAAILPLLSKCKWNKDVDYLEGLIEATRTQAIHYPRFLKRQADLIDPLSAAEVQVLKLLYENLSNQEIGEILGIKLSTVKTHVSRILHKLGVKRRGEAKAVAERLRLI